jgi:hypothetical protein
MCWFEDDEEGALEVSVDEEETSPYLVATILGHPRGYSSNRASLPGPRIARQNKATIQRQRGSLK